MGYPHIAKSKKLEAIAYHLAGLSQADAARLAGVKSNSLSTWLTRVDYKSDLIVAASDIVNRAKQEAIRYRSVTGIHPQVSAMTECQIAKEQETLTHVPTELNLPKGWYFDGRHIRKQGGKRKYSIDGFRKIQANGEIHGAQNIHKALAVRGA